MGLPADIEDAIGSKCAGAVVLGMGRSGTSAVVGALLAARFYAGRNSDLLEPDSSQPGGYWEHSAIVRLNEEILGRIGGTWFLPPTTGATLDAAEWAQPKLRDILARLRAEAGALPLAVKDPRIGVLIELWGPLIADLLHPVLVIRNPIEIALSLAARDNTPTAFALASWELHMARVLAFLHGRVVTVARYQALLNARDAVEMLVVGVATRLGRAYGAHVDPSAAANAIRPELHRNDASPIDPQEHLTGRQFELWRFLDGLEHGNQTLIVPPELIRPNAGAAALARHEPNRGWYVQRVDQLRTEVGELRIQIASLESAVADERARAERAEERSARAEHWLFAIQQSASWRVTSPLRAILHVLRRFRAQLIGPH